MCRVFSLLELLSPSAVFLKQRHKAEADYVFTCVIPFCVILHHKLGLPLQKAALSIYTSGL